MPAKPEVRPETALRKVVQPLPGRPTEWIIRISRVGCQEKASERGNDDELTNEKHLPASKRHDQKRAHRQLTTATTRHLHAIVNATHS